MSDDSLRIFREQLAALLREFDASGADLASIHSQLASDIVAKLRALPENSNMSTEQLQALFEQEISKTLPRRASIIRTNIEAGAAGGRKAARMTIRTVFGDQVQDKHVRATAKALSEAGERIAGRVTVDGVGLTKRLRRVDREIAQEMAAEVQAGIRQRRGILGAARKIERLDPRAVELPQYLQELERAARLGKVDEVKKLAKGYASRIAKLGEIQPDGAIKASKYSLRSATKKLVADVQKSSGDGLDKIVERYVQDKAAFRANLISRHETAEAYRGSYVEQTKNKPGVWGYRWTLSTRHSSLHKPGTPMDVCDIYASQDIGYGKGIYPTNNLPKTPHPQCLCSQSAMIRSDVFDVPESEQNQPPASARDHKSPDAVGWLKQNDAAAARILGPTRYALFKDGRDVLDANGAPRLVRDLLGHSQAAE